ncbi:MAG: GFA family protein [Acidiferrobacterales bacterium]
MKTYNGSCHCGSVTFELKTDAKKIIQCNCSVCTKKGALHLRVSTEEFELLTGKDALMLYQFGTRTASHYFCKHCGIHPYSNPRIAPDMVSVNVRCLDDTEITRDFEIVNFDGRHWQDAVKALQK